jgi:hypothetical protein
LSRRLAHDPRWRNLSTNTFAAGAAAFTGFIIMRVLVVPDGAPLHDWVGLAQRLLILVILFPCRIVLAIRLLHVTEDGDGR